MVVGYPVFGGGDAFMAQGAAAIDMIAAESRQLRRETRINLRCAAKKAARSIGKLAAFF